MSVENPVINYIDGEARRIYLLDGVSIFHPIDDIYREVRELRETIEDLRKFNYFCEAGGNIQRVGESYTPRYLRLLKGTKIVAGDNVNEITITGDIFTDNPLDNSVFDNDLLDPGTKISYNFKPPEAEIIYVNSSGSTGLSSQDLQSIWTYATRTTLVSDKTGFSLTQIDKELIASIIQEVLNEQLTNIQNTSIAARDHSLIAARSLQQ